MANMCDLYLRCLYLSLCIYSVFGGDKGGGGLRNGMRGLADGMKGFAEGLDKLGGLFDMFDVASTDCVYECSNGAKPEKNPNHKRTSNGCGSMGLEIDTESMPEMTRCCDRHDICYDTCGNNRNECDDRFKKCLDKMCKMYKDEKKLSKQQLSGCKTTADLMYAGTVGLGCKSYLEAQKNACICRNKKKNTEL